MPEQRPGPNLETQVQYRSGRCGEGGLRHAKAKSELEKTTQTGVYRYRQGYGQEQGGEMSEKLGSKGQKVTRQSKSKWMGSPFSELGLFQNSSLW